MIFKLGKYILLCAFIVVLTNLSHATPKDSEKNKQELSQLKKEIQKLQRNLKSKQKQQNKAISNLKSTEKKIATATKILRSTNRKLTRKESELKRLRRQQKNLDKNKRQQKAALAQQVRSAFINGRQEYIKLLLNQEDPEALGRMLVYYDYMNKARSQKMAKLQQTIKELENIDVAIQKEIRQLTLLKNSKEQETNKLTKLKSKRKKLVDTLAKEIKSKTQKLTELQINAKELQELIDSVREAIDKIDFSQPLDGLRSLKGKLRWPTKGKTIQRYGSRLEEGLKSNGVVIGAKEGKAVNAIHYGRVVYADWLRGFGLLVIIDHGKGYMSLYGYNQALYKQVGDWVESGESIATVGQSGGKQQPGLYFELRHQGKPFNPKRWFGK
ncbi:murein hydrolase activator EnvC family protein [Aliikangiella sp. IMCC44359]|uniref:murein hydrolase activator EnvC family protein n=1 Tax=Aliikangiella sp. IMCC44359 TaxID=3459125 RepID=UPI00403AF463